MGLSQPFLKVSIVNIGRALITLEEIIAITNKKVNGSKETSVYTAHIDYPEIFKPTIKQVLWLDIQPLIELENQVITHIAIKDTSGARWFANAVSTKEVNEIITQLRQHLFHHRKPAQPAI